MRRKLFKWTAITLGASAALLAVALIAFQVAMSRVPDYRVQLQDWVSEKTKLSVEFTQLSARLRLFGPELAFADVTVRTPDKTRVLATARGGSVAFDWWRSLRTGRITAGRFTLDSPQLGLIRARDGHIQIAGLSLFEGPNPFAIEQLPVGKLRVRDAVVSFQDELTGRGPWSFSGVGFTMSREPRLLTLNGDASLPTALGGKLQFTARAAGVLERPADVVSTVSIQGAELDLTGWADLLPARWPAPASGRGSLDLALGFVGPTLRRADVKASFADVTSTPPRWSVPIPTAAPLQLGGHEPEEHAAGNADAEVLAAAATQLPEKAAEPIDDGATLSYERIALDARLERDGDGWRAQVNDLELRAAAAQSNTKDAPADWRSKQIELTWKPTSNGGFDVAGKIDHVNVQSVTPWLAYLPESDALARVRGMKLRGTLRDLDVTVARATSEDPLRYSLSAAIDAVGFAPVLKVPGVTGLTGQLRATEANGELKLDTGPVVLSIPWMFRWPMDTRAVRATLAWRHDADGWHVETNDLQFDADDGKGEAKLAIRVPQDGSSPQLDISAQARDLNAASTPKYLPANLLSPPALEWLDRAFVSGRVQRASLELHGPTRAFPFRQGGGEFVVKGFVHDLKFDYQPGWTPATQLTGEVEFRNEGMQASHLSAQVGDMAVTQASGRFGDFKKGDLSIAAEASGDLGAGLELLQASPIGAALGDTFKALHGAGEIQSKVSLYLPILNIADRKIAVATRLTNATVRLEGLEAPVTSLNGSLIVRRELPVEADLKGDFLGGAVNVTITPDDRTDEVATLTAQGIANAERLARFVPSIVKMRGALDWRMSTQLTSRGGQRAQVYTIASQTQGFGLDLPYPVGKSVDGARPLRVELEQRDKQVLARAAFGSMRALLRIQQNRGEWVFERGGVRADGVAAALPDHTGLRIEGAIDRLRLDDWLALRGTTPANNAAAASTKVSDILRAANVRVGTLELYGYAWPDVRGVMQAIGGGWRIDVTGANAEGQLFVPEDFTGDRPLTLDFERLVVTRIENAAASGDSQTSKGDPREWPALRVHIGDMHVENHPIGGVDLATSRVADGMRIDSLAIAQDAVQAEASGEWLMGPQGEHSSLKAKITSTDVRATLRALNYTEFLEAKRAEVSGELTWPGGFDASVVRRATGTIAVSADAGRLLTLQPGAGRVLGLFSVAALPRRLSLDFSDLTEKGLSFDTIHGDFELREGNAYTSNLLLRGPAAEIGVVGRTGLASQDYDQTAIVTGNLGASIPVAGALAGGPVVGAALLLFSQVFKEPLKGIARGYYKIKGTWDEPIVERVDAAEAKESALVRPKVDG